MKKLFIIAVLGMVFQSCATRKKIQSGSILFSIIDNKATGTADEIRKYKVTKGFRSEINDKTETIILSDTNLKNNILQLDTKTISIDQATQGSLVGKYFYGPARQYPNSKALKTIDSKFALQTLAIAFKVRPSVTVNSSKISQVTEAGSSFGFAPGWKFNYTWFGGKKNIFGQNFNRFSLTPGAVLGFGTTDLKKGVSSYSLDKKEAILTTGIYFMFGFNNVNFGLILGNDRSIGKSGIDWYYNKKWWRGIAVGLDLIK